MNTISSTSSNLADLAERARVIAIEAHRGETRRDGKTPYTSHLRATVTRLEGEPEEVIAAGWLHDSVENQRLTLDGLHAAGMPEEVRAAVFLLTKCPNMPYLQYLAHIRGNPIARKVKIADMLANLADDPTPRQIRKYAEGLLYLTDPV